MLQSTFPNVVFRFGIKPALQLQVIVVRQANIRYTKQRIEHALLGCRPPDALGVDLGLLRTPPGVGCEDAALFRVGSVELSARDPVSLALVHPGPPTTRTIRTWRHPRHEFRSWHRESPKDGAICGLY